MANNWKKVKLGALGTLKNGANFSSKDYGNDHPVVSVKSLFRGRYAVTDGLDAIKSGVINNIDGYLLAKDDILFARSSLKRSGSGQSAIVGNPPKGTIFSGFTIRFRVNSLEESNPLFIFYNFQSPQSREVFARIATGTTISNLSQENLKSVEISLPPLTEQKAIAHILGTLDDKIELNRQMNETLEDMAQTLFKSWFVDFDPVIDNALLAGNDIPDELAERAELRQAQLNSGKANTNSEINDLFPNEFEFSEELGWIPQGWGIKTLSEVTSEIIDHRGKTPKKLGGDWVEDGYPAISAKNIKGNKIVRPDTIRFVNEDMYKRWMKVPLERGDVLMTSEAPLGELYYLNSGKQYVLSQRLYGIRANKSDCSGAYLFYWLQTNVGSSSIQNRATGTTVMGIKQSELRKVEVLCPSNDILEQFNFYSISILERMDSNDSSNTTLAKLRDTLLPKLMSGELRIADAEKLVEDI